MCGIFGFAGRSSWKTSALLQALTIEDEIRGKHSTGLVIQDSSGSCYLQKKALKGSEFVAKGFTSFLFKREYALALGHNRYATAGAVNDRNAHPFGVRVRKGWCFGIHNGIVGSKEKVAEQYGVEEPDVDSEVVFRAIAKMQNEGMDVVDAIESVTEFISGDADFAFVYLDTSTHSIYMWRSPDRPLCIIDARKLKLGRWFCSTEKIFTSAWNSLRGALGPLNKASCFEAKPYRLYKVSNDGHFEVEPVRDLKHQSRIVEPKLRGWGSWHGWGCWEGYSDYYSYYQSQSKAQQQQAREADFYDLSEMSGDELEYALFNAQIELDGLSPHDPIYEEWEGYLKAIKKEVAKRKRNLSLFE